MLRSLRAGTALFPILLLTVYPDPTQSLQPAFAAGQCGARGQVAQVSAVQKGVRVRHTRRWTNAKKGTKVFAGDAVQTNKGQKAALSVCGGGKVYVNQGSVVVMGSRTEMQATKGEVAEHSASKGAQEIRTADGVARSHGTLFDVLVQKKQTVVTVASGAVSLRNVHGQVNVATNHQSAVQAVSKPAIPRPVDAQRALGWADPLAETWKVLTAKGVLFGPNRIALDSHGNIFTTDDPTSGRRVVKLSPNGQILAQWKLTGKVTEPIGIAVDHQDNVYVTDNIGNDVQKFTDNGRLEATYDVRQFTPGSTALAPSGIDLDASGNMYVVLEDLATVEKLSPSGQLLGKWGSQGSGRLQFNDPQDVAVDARGNIYVADHFNNRVQKLSPSGQFLLQWSVTKNQLPNDAAVDQQGDVYVAMSTEVDEYDSSGHLLRSWKNDAIHHILTDPGQFDHATGVTLDSKNNLYVADQYNNRIQKLIRNP